MINSFLFTFLETVFNIHGSIKLKIYSTIKNLLNTKYIKDGEKLLDIIKNNFEIYL